MAVSDNSQPGGSTNYVAGQLIIQFDPDVTPPGIQQILAGVGAQIADTLNPGGNGVGPLALAQLPPGLDPAVIAKALSHIPGVTFAEPNYVLSIQATSTDPAYTGGQLWGMEGDTTTPANAYGSQAGEAWASGYTGSTEVAVGVVDTGIDYKHPDLYKNVWLNQNEIPAAIRAALQDVDSDGLITFRDLNNAANAASVTDVNANGRIDAGDLLNDVRWENGADEDANGYKDDLIGWDFVNNDNDPYDDNSHGTHVSGTIGATANDGGAVGVNWDTQIVALKFLDASGNGSSANAIKALDYLTNASKGAGGQIDYAASNNSWGGDAFSQAMLDAIVRGGQQQILFVAAAGNGNFIGIGQNNDSTAFYPANYSTLSALGYDAVISVAALTSTGAKASFSNYGLNTVDIGAPGSSIYSTLPGGGWGTKSGTSMAAPHVTGAVALYSAAIGAGVSAEAIKAAILNSAAPTASLLDKVASDGRLDIGKLMAFLDQTPPSATGAIVDALDNVGAQTGALASGATTDDTSPQLRGTLTGTLAADEVLNVYRDGVKLGQAVVNGVSWSYQDTAVSNGAHGWTVRAADLAGNQGTASSSFSLTIQGPSIFYGTSGSDTVTGTSGADTIFGVLQSGGDLGRSEVDVLTGGGGADTFVLGDARGRFYDDGRSINAGNGDYARITDFNSAEGDKLQLAGSAGDYLQHVTTIGGVSGLGIYFDTNNNNIWGTRDELIAFLPGKSSLAAGDFVYV